MNGVITIETETGRTRIAPRFACAGCGQQYLFAVDLHHCQERHQRRRRPHPRLYVVGVRRSLPTA